MENIILKALKKDKKTRGSRPLGTIPAIVYGKGKSNQMLYVESQEFDKVFRRAGSSTIIGLDIEGEGKKVLVQDVSHHPVKDKIIHIDFYEVSMKEKMTAYVPVVFVGESAAIIDKNGTLITNKDEIEVECLPADLPQKIEVDISVLDDFEKAIHVSDLVLSDKVEVKEDLEEVVATVEPPRTEAEMAELDEPIAEVVLDSGQESVDSAEEKSEKE